MKFRNYLETIAGVGIYPLISLLIFFVFFVGLLIYVWGLDKRKLDKMRSIPLNDGVTKKALLSLLLLACIALPASAQETAEPVRAITGLTRPMLAHLVTTRVLRAVSRNRRRHITVDSIRTWAERSARDDVLVRLPPPQTEGS